MMKISLFNKPIAIWACTFLAIFIAITSVPTRANAGFFDFIMGSQAQAEDSSQQIEAFGTDDFSHNSQTLPLLESSLDPDMKSAVNSQDVEIIDNGALVANGIYGMGIENISNGEMTVYEVQSGDTLSEIAEMYDVSLNTIRWENNISGQTIKVGQKLNILPVTGVKHKIVKGDTLDKIANKYDADVEDIMVFNGVSKTDILKTGDILYIPNGIIKQVASSSKSSSKTYTSNTRTAPSGYYLRPVSGPITSPYGPRKGSFHYGIDIGNRRGTPVVAAANGVVVKVVNYCREGVSYCGGYYGNYIVVEHPNGTKTRYAHLQTVNVSVGQTVSQGEKIAGLGNTGRSTGPHLHFEVINSNGSTMRPPF